MSNRVLVLALAAGSLAGSSPGQTAAGGGIQVELRAVLMTGDILPTTGNVRLVQSIDVSDACYVGVTVEAFAPGTDNPRQVLLAGPHARTLIPVAVGGEALPGNAAYSLPRRGIAPFHIGRYGDITYQANLSLNGVGLPSLVSVPGLGGPHIIAARRDDQVPGQAPNVRWSAFSPHAQADSAFYAELATIAGPNITAANDQVLLTGVAGSRTLLQEGMPVASLGGATLGFAVGASSPTTLTAVTAWRGTVTFPGQAARQAIVACYPVQLAALSGDPAPGLPGVTFQEFRAFPSLGVWQAEIAFTAALAGRDVDATNRASIWTRSRQLLARGGQQAPGLPAGVRYLDFSAPVLYGRDNDVLFTASLQGAVGDQNRTALFAGPRGAVSLVARAGTAAPGTPDGVVFGAFAPTQDADPIYVNAGGAVVFFNRLRGPGVTTANDGALFAWTAEDGLTLIAREGQTIEARGETRTIAEIAVNPPEQGAPRQTSGQDGRRTILNRHGECFFIATFVEPGGQALMKAQVTHPPCVADFNADRFVDCFDYLDFVGAFERGDATADVNDDEFVDFFDYAEFVGWFETGC